MNTVLIVEDDQSTREQLARVVGKEGFSVLTAQDGKKALEFITHKKPEIVITDLDLPFVNGMGILSQVKNQFPHIQVIILTACYEENVILPALNQGVLDFLKKPLELDKLIVALGRAKEKMAESKEQACKQALLYIENTFDNGDEIMKVLARTDFQVFKAHDCPQALDIFSNTKIDVVLLDVDLPSPDCVEGLQTLRERSEDFEVIIFYSSGFENKAIAAASLDVFSLLQKPVDSLQLITVINKAIEKQTAARALKYRTRDLELAKFMIAGISQEKGIVINLTHYEQLCTKEFAEQLLHIIPMGLLVVEDNYRILFINKQITNVIGYTPARLDKKFVSHLAKMGIKKIQAEHLTGILQNIFLSQQARIEFIQTGDYSYISCISLTLLLGRKRQKAILLAIRGERK